MPITAADETRAATDTAARLRVVIGRLARLLRQQHRDGIGSNLLSAMVALDLHGPLTLGELAAHEQIAPPSVTKIVEKLEHLDYVARAQDPDDRRVHRVALTPAGSRELEHNRTLRTAWLAEQLRSFDTAELDTIETALPVLEQLLSTTRRADGGRP